MIRRLIFAAAAVSALAIATGAAARGPAIAVREPVIRPTAPGQPTTAAYLGLFNLTGKPIRLTGVSCDCAASVTPHQSQMVGGMMHMHPAGALTIPARGQLAFAPGGLHLMVMGLKGPIKAGDAVTMRLSFDHTPPMTVRFAARR
jgi:copper(I)-binding protein